MIHILSVITGFSQLFNVYSESCGGVQVANCGIVHNEPCGSVQPIYGMALKGHVFQTLRVPSSLHCLKACNNDIRCQSINHLMGKDICELNNRTKEARPENLIPDSTKLYMKRFKNRGKKVLSWALCNLLWCKICCFQLSSSPYTSYPVPLSSSFINPPPDELTAPKKMAACTFTHNS